MNKRKGPQHPWMDIKLLKNRPSIKSINFIFRVGSKTQLDFSCSEEIGQKQ